MPKGIGRAVPRNAQGLCAAMHSCFPASAAWYVNRHAFGNSFCFHSPGFPGAPGFGAQKFSECTIAGSLVHTILPERSLLAPATLIPSRRGMPRLKVSRLQGNPLLRSLRTSITRCVRARRRDLPFRAACSLRRRSRDLRFRRLPFRFSGQNFGCPNRVDDSQPGRTASGPQSC